MWRTLTNNWWLVLLRGICAIIFGLMAFTWPGITLMTLVLLYGAYALAEGILGLVAAFGRRTSTPAWWYALSGVLGILAGLFTFLWPGITAVVLLTIIGIWAIIRGIMEIVAAVQLRKVIKHEWALMLGGALSVIFGILLLARPLAGAVAMVWLIGIYAIIFGIDSIALALRLHDHKVQMEHGQGPMGAMPAM
jgi:uncharacterized membrane protein HdeD (DUF308 family)